MFFFSPAELWPKHKLLGSIYIYYDDFICVYYRQNFRFYSLYIHTFKQQIKLFYFFIFIFFKNEILYYYNILTRSVDDKNGLWPYQNIESNVNIKKEYSLEYIFSCHIFFKIYHSSYHYFQKFNLLFPEVLPR